MERITGGIAQTYYKEIPNDIITEARNRLPADFIEIVDEFTERYLKAFFELEEAVTIPKCLDLFHTTAYKAFRVPFLKSLQLEADGFEICTEITCKVLNKGHVIKEVPIWVIFMPFVPARVF